MKQDNDKPVATEVDPQVSANYDSLADEKTPANLDKAVLREAARAVRADNRSGSFGAWFRPVAFMATIGLSLAIILDLSDTTIFTPLADRSVEITAPAPASGEAVISDVFTEEAASAEQRIREVGATSGYALQSPTGEPAPSDQVRQLPALVTDVQVTKLKCSKEEKVAPETWWSCIESLRLAGPDEFADMELENLRKAFPDFELPE